MVMVMMILKEMTMEMTEEVDTLLLSAVVVLVCLDGWVCMRLLDLPAANSWQADAPITVSPIELPRRLVCNLASYLPNEQTSQLHARHEP